MNNNRSLKTEQTENYTKDCDLHEKYIHQLWGEICQHFGPSSYDCNVCKQLLNTI